MILPNSVNKVLKRVTGKLVRKLLLKKKIMIKMRMRKLKINCLEDSKEIVIRITVLLTRL